MCSKLIVMLCLRIEHSIRTILYSIFLITTFSYFAPSLLSTLQIAMEATNLGYSTKNIPTAKPNVYLRSLLDKTQTFLQRMRWKAYHFLQPADNEITKETFGFKTINSAPPIAELREFESRMLNIVQNVEFKRTDSEFQRTLSQDMERIRNDDKLYVAADKTTNFYRTEPETYRHLLKTNITKT